MKKCMHTPIHGSINFLNKNVVTEVYTSPVYWFTSLNLNLDEIAIYFYTTLNGLKQITITKFYLFTYIDPNCNEEMLTI